MKLIDFPERTMTFANDQPQYYPLPAHKFKDDPKGRIAFCWKLTWRERLIVLFRGVVWHQILTYDFPLQPQLLTTDKPRMIKSRNPNG